MGRIGRPPHPDILTPREWEVLRLLRQALTNEQIGERLGISANAAKYHVSQIISKLGVSNRWEAAAWRPESKPWWAAALALLGWPLRYMSLSVGAKAAGIALTGATLAGTGVLVWVETRGPGEEVVTVAHLPTNAPTLDASPTPAPKPERQPAYVAYTIQPGDTVPSIAAAFGINPRYILWNNPEIGDPDVLLVGETLLVPSVNGILYEVKRGDTLADIASYYQIDVQSIQAVAANEMSSPDSIKDGMVLLLPGAVPPQLLVPPPPTAAEVTAVAAMATLRGLPPPPPPPSSLTGYIWPWYGGITTYFSGAHPAIDIDGSGHDGAPVVASAAGQVILVAFDDGGLGHHVIIQHGDGSRTGYGHLSSISVSQGQNVAQGEIIGALGCTGDCTGTELRFEMWVNGVPVDPLAYLP